MLGVVVPKESFRQGSVEPFHIALVPVNIHPAAFHLYAVLGEQLAHCAHKLAPRVHLEKLEPLHRPSLVNPFKSG